MKTTLLLQTFVLLLLIPAFAFGQATLRGTVSDSTTGETLPGVNVFLVGASLGCATNIEGGYVVTGIPLRIFKVKVSCVGFEPRTYDIDFSKKRDVRLDIALKPAAVLGSEVLITAQARGQVAAINQQLTSNTIMNVVSEERIKELPDANAAEALGRLSGVSIIRSGGEANRVTLRGLSDKFSAITIDGIRIPATDTSSRGVDLSLISQGSLAGIELFKALTSDKDGDAIAGSINLVTKKAPSERELGADLKGGYNNLMKSGKQYDFQLRYGERFFNNVLGVQVRGNLERKIRSNERTNINWNQPQTTFNISDFIVEFNDEVRTRNGVSLLLDMDTPDNGTIRLNTIINNTKRDYLYSSRNYPFGSGVLLSYTYRDREQEIGSFNSSLRGTNYLLGMEVTWGGSFAQSIGEYPYDYSIDFQETSDGVNSGMRSGVPELQGDPEKLIPYALNNFALSFAQNGYYRSERNLEKEKTAFLDIVKKYSVGYSIAGELKFGGKYRFKNRLKNTGQLFSPYYLGYWQEYTRNADGSITPKSFTGTAFEDFYNRYIQSGKTSRIPVLSDFLDTNPLSRDLMGKYNLKPIINRDKLRQWYDLNQGGVNQLGNTREYYNDPAVLVDYYDITERVAAGYLMNTLNFGEAVTFIAGVRVEKENNDYHSKYTPTGLGGFPIPSGTIADTTANFKEDIWLPNFQITARPTDFMNLRFAAYRAIARPDYNLRLLKYLQSGNGLPGQSGSNNSLLLGNSDLKTAKAWNFEVNTSFYGNEIGLLTVSAFYKEIKDLFHLLRSAPAVGKSLLDTLGVHSYYGPVDTFGVGGWKFPYQPSQQYILTMPYNSPKPTKVWGFELEHQANLNFLPGLLRNMVLNYNVSVIRSETYLMSSDTVVTYKIIRGVRYPQYSSVIKETKQKLEGQPELYGNVALGYDIGGFSARLSWFFQGKFNNTFSATQTSDNITNAYSRWDLALKHQLTPSVAVMLNVNNLTNIYETTSIANRIMGWTLDDTGQFYGLTADLGVRITL